MAMLHRRAPLHLPCRPLPGPTDLHPFLTYTCQCRFPPLQDTIKRACRKRSDHQTTNILAE